MEGKEQPCYLCGRTHFFKRQGSVRDNPDLNILECAYCGLVFLSSFSQITENFYEQSGMHESAIQIDTWVRETEWDDTRRFEYLRRLIENKKILDFGCGNGNFLLKARTAAREVAGVEIESQFKDYFSGKGLNVVSDINEASGSFDVITMFHVLEHIADPAGLLEKISTKLNCNGQLIVEVPNANDSLLSLYECEPFSHFTYWSCHLFLFSEATLAQVGKKAGLKVNYVKQIQRYSLANHLHWLAKGRPGGHREWGFLDSRDLQSMYEKQLASIGRCDTILASFSRET